jgi:hypothetical protein
LRLFDCPYLETKVELTDEREAHITRRHPDLLPAHLDAIADTLAEANDVQPDPLDDASVLFIRWIATIRGGRYAVVVVRADPEVSSRYWIATAYLTNSSHQVLV